MTALLPGDGPGVAQAAALLRAGRLVAFATETVYGLGANATDGAALAALFAAKGRPRFNPLIVHVAAADQAWRLGRVTPLARRLAAAFWPGPLSLVLDRAPACPVHDLATAGLPTLALRMPAHPVAQALLAAVAGPVAAPSANRSGRISPTTAAHVLEELGGGIEAVLDGGACPLGLESTVVDARGDVPVLLRPGFVTREDLAAAAGGVAEAGAGAAGAPGQLASHYAPSLPLRLTARAAAPDEALLGFGAMPEGAALARNLSPAGDLAEAAAALFGHLRALDAAGRARGLRRIAVMTVPEEGLGAAINDRLRRAAAPPETLRREPG